MRYYFMPMIRVGTWRGAKYMYFPGNESGLYIQHCVSPYGDEGVCCVAADTDAAQHSALIANTDVLALPVNLDNNLNPAAVTVAQNFFEALNIPANWINPGMTYRQVLKSVLVIFQLAQRFKGVSKGKLFDADTLSTQFNQLSLSKRQQLLEMADSLNLDASSLTATSTMRDILQALRSQLNTMTITMNGQEI